MATCWVPAPGKRMGYLVQCFGYGWMWGWAESSRQSGVWGSGEAGSSPTGLLSWEMHHLSWASVSSFDTFFQEASRASNDWKVI